MKKVFSLLICISMLFSLCSAATFTDMPDNWSTQALLNAVDNGLIGGSNGMIRPNDYMTRAEMATIMVRAFGATEEADISGFTDVSKDDWFYSAMAKAVAMGAFTGSNGQLNPNNNITRQEAFVVLARLFSLNYDKEIETFFGTYKDADTVLAQFSDKDAVSDWAKELVAALISGGYVGGSNGCINPTNNITRAEFAAVMDRCVKTYIDDAGTYSTLPEGSVIIRGEGVILSNAAISGDLIIAEGAKDGATLKGTDVSGRFIVRTGKKTVVEDGNFDSIRLVKAGVVVNGKNANRKIMYVVTDSEFVENTEISFGN